MITIMVLSFCCYLTYINSCYNINCYKDEQKDIRIFWKQDDFSQLLQPSFLFIFTTNNKNYFVLQDKQKVIQNE